MKNMNVDGASVMNTEVLEFKYDAAAEFNTRLWRWNGIL